ncbi:MAG: citrate/2-methylcitrate synthase, partial [Sandaracinaceae bacterium]
MLDSAITSVEGGRIRYRGRPLAALIEDGAAFEAVAELLWKASPRASWPEPRAVGRPRAAPEAVWRFAAALPAMALADPDRHARGEAAEHDRGRRVIRAFAVLLAGDRGPGRVAEQVARGLGGSAREATLVDRVLVACADHELNMSTFAARIAASSGADLYASVGAALYTFSGPRHGAAPRRVHALVEGCAKRGVEREVRSRLGRGERLPGFGHPLYPEGDPRTPLLLSHLGGAGPRRAPVPPEERQIEPGHKEPPQQTHHDDAQTPGARAHGRG